MADWRAALGFSARLQEVSKITAAYKDAHPECKLAAASKYAKSLEESIRKNAATQAEYRASCAKAVQSLLDSAPSGAIEDHHSDEHIFPNLPNSGATIGRYTNANHYGDGLFSEVFFADNPNFTEGSDRSGKVALKITTPQMMTAPHDSVREARILEAAKGTNIIPLLEAFQHASGQLVLVFPFLAQNLGTLLRNRRLNPKVQRSILRDLFSGLSHLHGLGIIHRDIKPTNMLLASPEGPAYISDFGISWSPSDPASEPADSKILDVGTTCYRPPELLFGNASYGTALDLWAAGCLAAQVVCLGGATLFDAGDLGSELALIRSIFQTLGTPDLKTWPEAARLPDWGKMNFTKYPGREWEEILTDCESGARDLVRNLVVFESGDRTTAEQALRQAYLR